MKKTTIIKIALFVAYLIAIMLMVAYMSFKVDPSFR